MAEWNKILEEIHDDNSQAPIDKIRKKYIKQFSKLTGRNVICYYSGFLSCSDNVNATIGDSDLNGFMTVISGLDKSLGLDLIIHSPGGDVAATEAIGNYLRGVFNNDIRIFVPQIAMSGGTMLACIGSEIYMGKYSSLGPIDPQYGGLPAYGVIQEFEQAKEEIINNPQSIPFWQSVIAKYPPAFIGQCYKAVQLSYEVLENWLRDGNMFISDAKKEQKITKIMEYLNNTEISKIHSRHIGVEMAKNIGLRVTSLEDNCDIQDAILSIHNCYMHTFQGTNAIKIFENQCDVSFIVINDK